MVAYGIFTIWIEMDGQPMPEFDVVHHSAQEVSCWIPSEAGKVRLGVEIEETIEG